MKPLILSLTEEISPDCWEEITAFDLSNWSADDFRSLCEFVSERPSTSPHADRRARQTGAQGESVELVDPVGGKPLEVLHVSH